MRDLVQHQFECVAVGSNMPFLDIKDPTRRAALVNEYVTSMKTVKRHNMANREMKLTIEDELQTLFHPIVNVAKQTAEDTRRGLAQMKKALPDIDALDRAEASSKQSLIKPGYDSTFGQLAMESTLVQINGKTLKVDDTDYQLTSGLVALIHDLCSGNPRISAHTNVKSSPNRAGTARSHAMWKWKHMLRKMVIPGERIDEEGSEDTDDTDTGSVICFDTRYW